MIAQIEWGPLLAGLFGGLGLFLLGLQRLTESLKALAGDRLRAMLDRLTVNRVAAAATGTAVTAIVQSSSVTTVLTIGFVSAGMMGFTQSLGVIVGANVGTTITAQAIAFDIRTWALAMVAVGAIGLVFSGNERITIRADALLGLGLVFFAMQLMSQSMAPLRDSEFFLDAMTQLGQPLLGLLVGALFTALVQSSSATTAVVIALLTQSLITPDAAIAVVIGANVGTCATAGLASIGKPPAAKRVALAHIGFNLIGALGWIGFVGQLEWLANQLPGSDADEARALANAHLVFNVTNALIALPLLGLVGKALTRLVPDRALRGRRNDSQLDASLVVAPSLALEAARVELARMTEAVLEMTRAIPPAVLDGNRIRLDHLATADNEVDERHRIIVDFLGRLGRGQLTEAQTQEMVGLLGAANDLESIGDVIENNLVRLGRRRLTANIEFDPETRAEILRVHREVLQALELAVLSLLEGDLEASVRSVKAKALITELLGGATSPHTLEVAYHHQGPRAVEVYTLVREITDSLQRIYYFARRLARVRLGTEPSTPADEVVPADENGPEPAGAS